MDARYNHAWLVTTGHPQGTDAIDGTQPESFGGFGFGVHVLKEPTFPIG